MNEKTKQNDSLILFALVLFLGAGAFLYLAISNHQQLKAQQEAQALHPVTAEEINFNLKATLEQEQLNRLKALDEIKKGKFDPKAQTQPPQQGNSISFESENNNQVVQEALRKGNPNPVTELSPDEIIQAHLYEIQVMRQMDEAYKKEYAKKFIAYARSKGYAVKLDSQLKIISLRRIPVDRNPSAEAPGIPSGKN